MKKLTTIIFSLLIVFVLSGSANSQTRQRKPIKKAKNNLSEKKSRDQQKAKTEFVCDLPVSVTAMDLSQTEIILNCPPTDKSCTNNKIIKVKITTVDPEGVEQKYVYTVSGGKIIGEGAEVDWDLSDVEPGNYKITAGIAQPYGKGWEVFGVVKTKVVEVKE